MKKVETRPNKGPYNILPVMTILANLVRKPEGKLELSHEGSPIRPEVKVSTGAQTSCIGEEVFRQFRLSRSVLSELKGNKKKVSSELGVIKLDACST